jgi:hypothetical protein
MDNENRDAPPRAVVEGATPRRPGAPPLWNPNAAANRAAGRMRSGSRRVGPDPPRQSRSKPLPWAADGYALTLVWGALAGTIVARPH